MKQQGEQELELICEQAKQALDQGREEDFFKSLLRYGGGEQIGWHPDRYRHRFWGVVLGEDLCGGKRVPESFAREELFVLFMNRHALRPLPEAAPLPSPHESEEVEHALATLYTRQLNIKALQALNPKNALVQACQKLCLGEWKPATKLFLQFYGQSEHGAMLIEQNRTAHALPLAIFCAIKAGSSKKLVERWLEYAQAAIIEWHGVAQSDILEQLHVLDGLLNRGQIPSAIPHTDTASPLLLALLGLCRAYLPTELQEQIDTNQLDDTAELLETQGELFWAKLLCNAQEEQEENTAQIFWDFKIEKKRITHIEPRLCTNPLSTGRPIALKRLLNGELDAFCHTADFRLRPCIISTLDKGRTLLSIDLEQAVLFARHPHLRLIRPDNTRAPFILRKKYSGITGNVIMQADGVYAISTTSPRKASQTTRNRRAAAYILCARMTNIFGHYFARLYLKLTPENDFCVSVADGAPSYPIRLSGETIIFERDFAEEIELTQACIQQCPALQQNQCGAYYWEFASLEASFQALAQLQKVPHLYIISDNGRVPHMSIAQHELSLSYGKLSQNWLEIGAHLQVNEERVLELRDLLSHYEGRVGNFLSLPGGDYVQLSKDSMAQLHCLSQCCQAKGKGIGMSLAALPRFTELWTGGDLPASIARARETMNTALAEELPAELTEQLRPYQREGLRWLRSRAMVGIGTCLADDMGLGKTIQLLRLLQSQVSDGPSLVIAPTSLLQNWAQEAARFTPKLRIKAFDTQNLQAGDLVIASYGQLISKAEFFMRIAWNGLVLDEAQAIKNPSTKRAQALCKLKARFRVAATGTPVENKLLELWSIMHFLNPNFLAKRLSFLREYQAAEKHADLRALLAPLLLRRRKEEVLQELPPLTEIELPVELDEEERALYESIRREALQSLQEKRDSFTALTALTKLRRLCCHASLAGQERGDSSKIHALLRLAEQVRESGHRALIFSQFTDVLQLAQQALEHKLGANCLYLDGKTSAKKRQKNVQEFQNGSGDFFLISLKAGGTGLNLTAADYVILLDPWWNPAIEAQAASRAHRMGQQQPVTLCRLICRDTVEEHVLKLHETKRELAEQIIDQLAYSPENWNSDSEAILALLS